MTFSMAIRQNCTARRSRQTKREPFNNIERKSSIGESKTPMANFWNDIKHSLHMFIKNPGFTIAAVAALALGIGANTAIFTVVNAVLLKPLSYPNADRIVQFLLPAPTAAGTAHRFPSFTTGSSRPASFRRWPPTTSGSWLQHHRRPPGADSRHACHRGLLPPLRRARHAGPHLHAQEDAPNGGKVVVLSYGLWQRKFGGNPNVVGRRFRWATSPTPSSACWGGTSSPIRKPTSGCLSSSNPTAPTRATTFRPPDCSSPA
jgi:hypothetical protein